MLAIARTFTSAVRLLDELELFRGDFRVQVLFSVDSGSRFNGGVDDLLRRSGALVVGRDQSRKEQVDLVLTASENADVEGIDAPVLVLPHGAGFHKYVIDPRGAARLSGVATGSLAQHDKLHLAITHERQRRQLDAVAPGLAQRAVVTTDTIHRRLQASLSLRDHYRRALGVDRHRQLVLLSSTWGEQALLGQWQRLPARLLRELPADQYAVAAVLHPNVWYGHGPWQVRTWLADAEDAGLLIIPPDRGWQAAVVGADLVIGDHGSVTFYAAAIGRPVILAVIGGDEVAQDTPLADLVGASARLTPGTGLRAQVDETLAAPPTDAYRSIRDRAFDPNGGRSLRSLVYELLRLPEPTQPAELSAWPAPVVASAPVTGYRIHTRTTGPAEVQVSRFPAAVDDPRRQRTDDGPGSLRHLSVFDDELHLGRRQSASVLVRREVLDLDAALGWVREQGAGHFLTACATLGGTVLVGHRGTVTRLAQSGPTVDAMVAAAAFYHLLREEWITLDETPSRVTDVDVQWAGTLTTRISLKA